MADLYVKMAAFVGTVFYNPVDDVTVTHEPTEVTANDWVIDQLHAGLIVECDAPAPAAAPPAPVAEAAPESEPDQPAE